MADSKSNYRFVILGKSKYVHAVRTKAQDLKAASKDGSQCQQVRKYQVAGKVPKKGMSREAASALDPCPNCDTAGVLAVTETPDEKRARRKAESDDLRQRIRDEQKPKGKKAKAAKPVGKGTKAKTPSAKPSLKGGDLARAKADTLAEFANEHGWSTDIGPRDDGPGIMLTATRGDETIECFFIEGRYDIDRHAVIKVGSWEGKLRGMHGCRRQMSLEGRDRPHPNPGQGRSGPRSKPVADEETSTPEDDVKRLPFLMDDDDVTVLAHVLGKTIRWRNGVSGVIEEARVPSKVAGKKRDKVKLITHPKTEKRMLNFLVVDSVGEHGEEYGVERTVYLDKIVRVVG